VNTAWLLEMRGRICLWLAEALSRMADRLMAQARRDIDACMSGVGEDA
jgi:hypothetical protein